MRISFLTVFLLPLLVHSAVLPINARGGGELHVLAKGPLPKNARTQIWTDGDLTDYGLTHLRTGWERYRSFVTVEINTLNWGESITPKQIQSDILDAKIIEQRDVKNFEESWKEQVPPEKGFDHTYTFRLYVLEAIPVAKGNPELKESPEQPLRRLFEKITKGTENFEWNPELDTWHDTAEEADERIKSQQ